MEKPQILRDVIIVLESVERLIEAGFNQMALDITKNLISSLQCEQNISEIS